MKKLVVTLLILSFVLAGVSLVAADNLPKSLKGVDLQAAKQVTDKEATEVRGTADRLRIHLQTCTPDRLQVRTPGVGVNCPYKVK